MKHFELTEENQQLFIDLFDETGLNNYMQLKLIGIAKSKEVIKVAKPNDVAKYVGHLPDDMVTIIVYEEAFDRLDEENKKLLISDALNMITYDSEKDKIGIGVPQIVVTVGGRQKYGDELINAAEMGVLAIQQIDDEKQQAKEEERARKAAEKAAKNQRNN